MVCPYRLATGMITAVMSIWYVKSTLYNDDDMKSDNNNLEGIDLDAYLNGDDDNIEKYKEPKKQVSPLRRAIVIGLLILLHIDILYTGYLRNYAKEGISQIMMMLKSNSASVLDHQI